MRSLGSLHRVLALISVASAAACGSPADAGGEPPLLLAPLPRWDGGADAGCVVATEGVKVQCYTAYRIAGDPRACPGFDDAGTGSTKTCRSACMSGLVCSLSGLSDGTSAVACQSNCSSPEH